MNSRTQVQNAHWIIHPRVCCSDNPIHQKWNRFRILKGKKKEKKGAGGSIVVTAVIDFTKFNRQRQQFWNENIISLCALGRIWRKTRISLLPGRRPSSVVQTKIKIIMHSNLVFSSLFFLSRCYYKSPKVFHTTNGAELPPPYLGNRVKNNLF